MFSLKLCNSLMNEEEEALRLGFLMSWPSKINPLEVKTNTELSPMDSKLEFIAVSEEEGCEAIELPCEDDGCLLLSTLQAQFSGASGLKYRAPDTNAMRGIRLSEGRLFLPDTTTVCICSFPKDNKRKGDEGLENPASKTKKIEKCTDLIVMGLPWRTAEEEMRNHFDKYGPLVLCTIKRDPKNGRSRGYGFIRFQEFGAQVMCLANEHFIDGRWCDVKIPDSRQQEGQDNIEYNRKIFVGQLPDNITQDELYKYFSQLGKVTDVFIPRPFRSFAFVTFAEQDVAHSILNREHSIKGSTVSVGTAVPKIPHHMHQQQRMQQQVPGQHFNPFYQQINTPVTHGPQGGKFGHMGPLSGTGMRPRTIPGSGDPNNVAMAALNMFNPAMLAALGNMFSGVGAIGPRGDMGKGPYGAYSAYANSHDNIGHRDVGGGY